MSGLARLGRFAPVLALAVTLSCADMPTAPKPIVTVTGQITDRDGPGIEQVYITFYSLDPRDQPEGYPIIVMGAPRGSSSHGTGTVTDGSGRYKLVIAAGRYRVFLEPRRGYPYVELPSVTIEPERPELNYRYTGVRITGTVTGPGGMELPNAQVSAYPVDHPYPSVGSDVISDRYSILLPAGTYDLSAGSWGATGFPVVEIRSLAVARDTTLDFVLDGHLVTGIVRGRGGLPLERIRVRALNLSADNGVSTFTKADGTYAMYVPSGTYAFDLEPYDARYLAGRSYPQASIAGPATLDFDMSGVEWSGTVRRVSDSTAVEASVTAYEIQTGFTQHYARALTDSEGRFRLIVGPNTLYHVEAGFAGGWKVVGILASGADSTFDIYVNAPLP